MKKCEKCDKEMKKSDRYAHSKGEGEAAHNGPDKISYCCMDEKCKNFGKNIIEIES